MTARLQLAQNLAVKHMKPARAVIIQRMPQFPHSDMIMFHMTEKPQLALKLAIKLT